MNGVLLVDKPTGPTSHDAVGRVRRVLGERRVGHTGTLDPFASGLLVMCVGSSTRLSEYLTRLDKSYLATVRLGVETDSHDSEGATVVGHAVPSTTDPDRLELALERLRGPIQQVPPRFSAKKVDGRRAHERAREGEVFELEPVPVTVYDLTAEWVEPHRIEMEVRCSSGTYVRALARDLGRALGTGAHLTSLRRTVVGPFTVGQAIPLDQLDRPAAVEGLVSPSDALTHLPTCRLTLEAVPRIRQGQRVPTHTTWPEGPIAVVVEGELVAVAEAVGDELQPRKVFV